MYKNIISGLESGTISSGEKPLKNIHRADNISLFFKVTLTTMKFLAIAILLLILIGCSSAPLSQKAPYQISVTRLTEQFHRLRTDHVIMTDRTYALPKKEWMFSTAYMGFLLWQQHLYAPQEGDTKWDCDDYAGAFRIYLRTLHAIYRTHRAQSIAVGTVYYWTDRGTGHAINVFLIPQGGIYEKVYIEPQSGQEVHLSQYEEARIWFVHF